mmetsp:Transcript_14142/g.19702  ORF Transcript_14142/g.19702 Transcript_14142/m.19702 type:complete len:148 (+) Transcript_14142:1820-2263(+)
MFMGCREDILFTSSSPFHFRIIKVSANLNCQNSFLIAFILWARIGCSTKNTSPFLIPTLENTALPLLGTSLTSIKSLIGRDIIVVDVRTFDCSIVPALLIICVEVLKILFLLPSFFRWFFFLSFGNDNHTTRTRFFVEPNAKAQEAE